MNRKTFKSILEKDVEIHSNNKDERLSCLWVDDTAKKRKVKTFKEGDYIEVSGYAWIKGNIPNDPYYRLKENNPVQDDILSEYMELTAFSVVEGGDLFKHYKVKVRLLQEMNCDEVTLPLFSMTNNVLRDYEVHPRVHLIDEFDKIVRQQRKNIEYQMIYST